MNKLIKILIILVVIFIGVPVFAATHETMELIDATETSTVDTDLFTYSNISYSPNVAGKTFGKFSFGSITNKSDKKVPISINILLFDNNMKNVGYVTYCTDVDYGGDYSQRKLNGGEAIPFYINIGDKYFVEGKGPVDVIYYAVQDDNHNCHNGGYDKYEGLTIEEIKRGVVMVDGGTGEKIAYDQEFINMFLNISQGLTMFIIIGSLVVCIVKGLFLNALYKRMFGMTSPFSYFPICSEYIAVKLAFGQMAAKICFIVPILAVPLSLLIPGIGLISIFVGLANGLAYIIDLIKLITKNYGLCYLEPYTPFDEYGNPKLRLPSEKTKVPVVQEKNEEVTDSSEDVGSKVLDLNYEGEDTNNSNSIDVSDDLNKNILDDDNKDNKEEESDLMNLFK